MEKEQGVLRRVKKLGLDDTEVKHQVLFKDGANDHVMIKNDFI